MMSREASTWAIRFFLGREPSGDDEIEFHRQHSDLTAMRKAFLLTTEFQQFIRETRGDEPYRAPLFLLDPPAAPNVPTRFSPPSLAQPVSQLCTHAQVAEPAYEHWCRALDLTPVAHRKRWEYAYIVAVMDAAGVLLPGCRALAFGVGAEHTPSYLASRGLEVVATDAPLDAIQGHGWESTNQHAQELSQIYYPNIVSRDVFERLVSYRTVDMNNIPNDLRDFDVCWSSCCFEHLGSLKKGLDFVVNSLETLKPGGVAIHTTEFNLSSNDDTFEAPTLSIYRKRDIEGLLSRLVDAGHEVWPLSLHPGSGKVDEHIDLPPYAFPHLKIQLHQYICTSLGIVVRKRT
jgi:2-polyprenyl-3-methyl-5-hydroxy-6-metoxy-1,4-benzoquinol methylase